MSVASNGTEKEDQTQLETDTNSLDQTYELWQHLAREEKKSLPCPNVMTKRQRKKFTKTLLRGFASGSKPNFRVSNLFSYEKRFSSCSKLSSDSESVEVDDLQRSQQLWVYLYGITHHLHIAEIIWVKNVRARSGGNFGLLVLNEIVKRIYPENLKKILGAVCELPAK